MAIKYDAFISYRHNELDSFVAKTLHKELEAFKLPANLVKQRENGSKTRIERVFRDKEELPLASNLSEPINEALENSEFLIVICTPRLLESRWCMLEIDTFIKCHGADHVLAVLAQGEPEDSFPTQLYNDNKEPLAADVRGKSKAAIKKKIKEEVMRIAAPMFECGYDDIRQRRREQMLKRRVITFGTAAIGMSVIGCVTTFQSLTIQRQNDKINEQYDEIYRQYNENLSYQSEILQNMAIDSLKKGDVLGAVTYQKEAILDKDNDKICDSARLILSEALGVYEYGSNIMSDGFVNTDSMIIDVIDLGNGNFGVLDFSGCLNIYSIENEESLFKKKKLATIKGINVRESIFYNYNKKSLLINDGKLIFASGDMVKCVSLEDFKEIWSAKLPIEDESVHEFQEGYYIIALNDSDNIAVVNEHAVALINRNSGELACRENNSGWEMDKYTIYDVCSGSSDECIFISYLKTYGGEDENVISEYNIESGEFTKTKNMGEWEADKLIYDTQTDYLFTGCTLYKEGNVYYNSEINYSIMAFDGNINKAVWQKSVDSMVVGFGQTNDSDTNDRLLIVLMEHGLMEFNYENANVNLKFDNDDKILNLYRLGENGQYCVVMDSGDTYFNSDDLGFINSMNKSTIENKLEGYVRIGNYCFVWENQSYKVHIYKFEESEKLEKRKESEVEQFFLDDTLDLIYDIEDDKFQLKKIIDENQMDIVFTDEAENYAIVHLIDNQVLLVDIKENKIVDNNFDLIGTCDISNCLSINDDYFVMNTSLYGYIISEKTGMVVAKVPSVVGYNSKEDKLIVYTYEDYYEVSLLALDELMDMTEGLALQSDDNFKG